eukprot:CAMPEP_0202768540 /NCGR_PEP_ID=MMETSP1388-20130828/34927_1 /ASSEMBLY_ACC=CAM_ASM_000864 /TAXON_ID=37098 /ORGANISM="Isochrysis sp, Strain CCMP1244" /LENGTH=178 /DNA_ID=CAMNT_0049437285 /DNA_START=1 /DNA_END=535 /DNA_ORIENTATION=-
MRAVLLSALFASVAAFAPPTALVPRVVDAPLTKALVLRGGGVISKETFATTLVVSNGLFGLQFLLIPKFFISQFFEKELDAFHLFFARFIGVLILGQCALLKVCPSETTFLPALITQIAVGIMGPLKAHLTLDPKMPIHLFPVITVFACAGLGLLAFEVARLAGRLCVTRAEVLSQAQ